MLPPWVHPHLPHQNTSGALRFWSPRWGLSRIKWDERRACRCFELVGRGRGGRAVYHVVVGCRVVAYIRIRTSRKMVMRTERDILVVGSIAVGEQAVLNQGTSRAVPCQDHAVNIYDMSVQPSDEAQPL